MTRTRKIKNAPIQKKGKEKVATNPLVIVAELVLLEQFLPPLLATLLQNLGLKFQ